MNWPEIRQGYPNQWLIIEAITAHTEAKQRILDQIAAIEMCADGGSIMQAYECWHHAYPLREFYFAHTGREQLDIRERHRIGIRWS